MSALTLCLQMGVPVSNKLTSIEEYDDEVSYEPRYNSRMVNIMDSSISIKEEDLMNISRDGPKDINQIELELNTLLKEKDSESETFKSNHDVLRNQIPNRINLHSLFENWVRDNKILGENFVLVWVNKSEQPKTFYDRAKNNLFDLQKK
jgi:hypothetical protein